MRWSAVLAAVLLVTAGCLGSTDEDSIPSADDDTEDEDPRTTWETVTRSGTVTGAGTPAGSISQGGGNQATWSVPQDTRTLYLNVTADGGQLSIDYGPDCNTQDTVQCEHSASTEDGEARLVHEMPNATGWEAYVFIQNNAGEVDWQLQATMGVVQR